VMGMPHSTACNGGSTHTTAVGTGVFCLLVLLWQAQLWVACIAGEHLHQFQRSRQWHWLREPDGSTNLHNFNYYCCCSTSGLDDVATEQNAGLPPFT
jgi:hypothetical protein